MSIVKYHESHYVRVLDMYEGGDEGFHIWAKIFWTLNSDVTSSREETNNIPEASVELMRLAIYTNSRM